MAEIDFASLDKKWQKKWEAARLFEANPSKRKKFFTSNVIPYVNGNAHIGHSYTFTRTDVYARFKRMQGFNTLLAQGFHATGEPILGTVERLKKGDQSQVDTYKLFGATSKDLEDFKKKGPKYVAEFWTEKMTESFKSIGFSIDWRRKFTLSVTPQFSRFVEWQYNTLRRKGYVVQGTHPVVWCPKDLSPTGDHDRLTGEGESPQEFTLIKFTYNGYVLPAATLRPETLYGVTNVWIADAEYVELDIDGERWIVSKDASKKLKDQMKNVKEIGVFEINQLAGKKCIEPLGNKEIPILPSKFVDPDNGTGIVMSVPAHAPYDWVAIKEMVDSNKLEIYGLAKNDLEPISVVQTQGLGEIPAVELCKKMKIERLEQAAELDEATAQLYKKEFHTGFINIGPYSGMKVSESKEKLTLDFIEKGIADVMWEVYNVVCRCTTKCHVKVLENQWFLKYSDEEWKKKVKQCLSRMKIYPEEARNNFENTIDWLKDKACARKSGLGTPMPWDKEWIIETLSDSTVYMAYYTISHIITKNKIPAEKLIDEVFDFVFLGKGDMKDISKKSKIKPALLLAMKKEFDYFYPLDIRNSAKDLVQNHLTFFIFQHTALFPESKWPKGISVNGYVNVEGEKMSKSKGNIIPLKDLVEQHGADMVRINIAASSEGIDDADWRAEGLRSFRSRFEFLSDAIKDVSKCKKTSLENPELYLMSRLQKNIEDCTNFCEQLMFRSAVQCALFDATNDLKWYLRRTGDIKHANKKLLKDYLETIIKMLAPFTPHICEELYHLTRKDFVSTAGWPITDENKLNADAESGEELLHKTLNDIEEVRRIAKIQPKKITLFVAEDWKFRIYQKVLRNKEANINDITKEIMSSGSYGKATVMFIQNLYKRINDLQPVLPRSKQFALLKEACGFLEKETGCKIEVIDSDNTENQKARSSTPNRFGLFLE